MRGGKRKGAGRKEAPYDTAMVRVPVPLLDKVRALIEAFRDSQRK
jgi:hypothetical protein